MEHGEFLVFFRLSESDGEAFFVHLEPPKPGKMLEKKVYEAGNLRKNILSSCLHNHTIACIKKQLKS